MFKFSAKQKLAIKSWVHAAIVAEFLVFTNFVNTFNGHFTLRSFLAGLGAALLAPITRWLATLYSVAALKYPMLKPIAAYIAKRAKKPAPVTK